MGKFPVSGNIIIANQTFHTSAKVSNWLDTGWNAKSTFCIPTDSERAPPCKPVAGGQAPYDGPSFAQRYSLRPALRRYGDNPPLEAAKAVIRQFVVHHDGCASSDMCFNVQQNERGLSCHFLIDNDGTIYQTLDLALAAWHAAEWNVASIGVELCNYGDANARPDYYSSGKHGKDRDKIPIKINGHKILSYGYTPEQITEFGKLVRELQRLLPNIPLEYPQSSPGVHQAKVLSVCRRGAWGAVNAVRVRGKLARIRDARLRRRQRRRIADDSAGPGRCHRDQALRVGGWRLVPEAPALHPSDRVGGPGPRRVERHRKSRAAQLPGGHGPGCRHRGGIAADVGPGACDRGSSDDHGLVCERLRGDLVRKTTRRLRD